MSFDYLPLPLYLLLTIGGAIYIIYFFIKSYYSNPAALSIGMILFGLSSISAGLERIMKVYNISSDNLLIIQYIPLLLVVPAITLVMAGIYLKVKNNTQKRKLIISLMIFIVVNLLIFAYLVIGWK